MSQLGTLARTASNRLANLADQLDRAQVEPGLAIYIGYRLRGILGDTQVAQDIAPAPRSPATRPAPRPALRR